MIKGEIADLLGKILEIDDDVPEKLLAVQRRLDVGDVPDPVWYALGDVAEAIEALGAARAILVKIVRSA